MAQIFRPVFHIDPATSKIVKASFSGAKRRKSPTWWIRYYTPDGKRHLVKGYVDKKATESKAAELERRGIRLAEGLADPLEDHAKRPLAEHLADYVRYLADKGNVPAYVSCLNTRLTSLLDGCRFVRLVDVQPSAVLGFLADLRAKGKSLKTVNDYLAGMKGFSRWLWRDKRTAVDPLGACPSWRTPTLTFAMRGGSCRPKNVPGCFHPSSKAPGRFAGYSAGIDSRCT
jgi:hypothetical protein